MLSSPPVVKKKIIPNKLSTEVSSFEVLVVGSLGVDGLEVFEGLYLVGLEEHL